MLQTRIVDDYSKRLYQEGRTDFVASCRGHEAAQVGSALCIEVGKDFTLPYYRDLGVVLTIGMTPYEVFRTYLQSQRQQTQHAPHAHRAEPQEPRAELHPPVRHWGYHKHNTVTGPAPVATQLLHAAGIAFASKLRKAPVVTVAYCGDGATAEPDFLEAIRFAVLHQLPVVFICEQDCLPSTTDASSSLSHSQYPALLPPDLTYRQIDGADVVTVYEATRAAIEQARVGAGPILLEMHVTRSLPDLQMHASDEECNVRAPATQYVIERDDPLVRCQHFLQKQGAWDEEWATQLSTRITTDIERALQNAMRDTVQSTQESRAE